MFIRSYSLAGLRGDAGFLLWQVSDTLEDLMMNVHFEAGHRCPSVEINTAYPFGLDCQESVVALETDSPSGFSGLVTELRDTEASRHALRDTPILTCICRSLRETLNSLGG